MGINALLILLSVVLGGVIVYARHRIQYWRERCYEVDDHIQDMFDRAITAEGDKARAELELNWIKQTVNVIASRNSIAILSDDQVNVLVNAIGQLVVANMKDPSKLN